VRWAGHRAAGPEDRRHRPPHLRALQAADAGAIADPAAARIALGAVLPGAMPPPAARARTNAAAPPAARGGKRPILLPQAPTAAAAFSPREARGK